MKCKHCGTENILKASYCVSCGQAFSEEEKKQAYNRTVYGKIDTVRKVLSLKDFEFITGNKFFRIALLAGILLLGWFSHSNQGAVIKLLPSEEYTIDYNDTRREYYLYSDLDTVRLQLYLPGKPEAVEICTLDEDGSVLSELNVKPNDDILLYKETPFYRISGIYGDKRQEILAVVYDSEVRP